MHGLYYCYHTAFMVQPSIDFERNENEMKISKVCQMAKNSDKNHVRWTGSKLISGQDL